MQFVLTQEEMDNLVPKAEHELMEFQHQLAVDRALKAINRPCVHQPGVYQYCDRCPFDVLLENIRVGERRLSNLCGRSGSYSH